MINLLKLNEKELDMTIQKFAQKQFNANVDVPIKFCIAQSSDDNFYIGKFRMYKDLPNFLSFLDYTTKVTPHDLSITLTPSISHNKIIPITNDECFYFKCKAEKIINSNAKIIKEFYDKNKTNDFVEIIPSFQMLEKDKFFKIKDDILFTTNKPNTTLRSILERLKEEYDISIQKYKNVMKKNSSIINTIISNDYSSIIFPKRIDNTNGAIYGEYLWYADNHLSINHENEEIAPKDNYNVLTGNTLDFILLKKEITTPIKRFYNELKTLFYETNNKSFII